MSFEVLTAEGFRVDGRRLHETRRVQCSVGSQTASEADGYAVFELGFTKAIAYVYGPAESERHQMKHDRAVLTCELSTAQFGTVNRSWRSRGDRQSQERSLWIQQALESAVMLEQFPRSQLGVYVQVLEAEGGTLAAAINAATLALVDAGIPMRDLVVACSAGLLLGQPALDLSREEEMSCGAQVLVAAHASSKKVTLLEVESKVPTGKFQPLYDASLEGCGALADAMRTCLMDHASRGFSARVTARSGQKMQ